MKNIVVINGPNLNFLGIRKKEIYGSEDYDSLKNTIINYAKDKDVKVDIFQSNYEGAIIDKIQQCYFDKVDGIIINTGAFTHYSYAIRDAIESVSIPTIEVHISNIYEREDFRKISVISPVCKTQIYGKGFKGYLEAIDYLINEREII